MSYHRDRHALWGRRAALVLVLALLGGCVPFWKRDKQGPAMAANANAGLQPHESWCYRTMGEIECYPAPQQDISADRLVSVDPPSRHPLTIEEYRRAAAAAASTGADSHR